MSNDAAYRHRVLKGDERPAQHAIPPTSGGRIAARVIGWSIFGVVLLAIIALAVPIVHGLWLAQDALDAQRVRVAELSDRPVADWAESAIAVDVPEETPLDQLQYVASHNSYVLEPTPLQLFVIDLVEPGTADTLRYSHPDLTTQLDNGVRAFELDPRNTGRRFTNTHVPLVANRSNAPDFALSLTELAKWSAAHPGHAPIFLHLDLKEDYRFLDPTSGPWDADAVERLDEVVGEVLGDRLITPSQLDERVGWPTLGESRGKFLVYIDNSLDAAYEALGAAGSNVFIAREDGTTRFAVLNDPTDREVAFIAATGVIVRTRADADTVIEPARRSAALDSGANLITTDYPRGEPGPNGYVVQFEGGATVRLRPPLPEAALAAAAKAAAQAAAEAAAAGAEAAATEEPAPTE